MKYCEHCGNKIPLFEKCSCEAAKKAQGESKWTTPMKATIIGVIAVAILVPILIVMAVSSKINTFDYVEVTFDGNDGYGTAYVSFDDRALISKIIGEAPNEMNFEEYFKWEMKYEEYSDTISYSCDKTENLSNGDTVTVTILARGDAASKIKCGSKTFTVENLPEAEVIDVFKDVEFEITGVSGYARLEIINNSENPFTQLCRFSADNSYKLKNGDKVTVMIEYDLDDSIRLNAVPNETVKVITVSGLPQFMTAKDVSKTTIDDIKANFENNELSMLEENEDAKFKALSYVGTYFYTPTENPDLSVKLITIYSADRYNKNGAFDDKVYLSLEYTGDVTYKEKNYNNLVVFPDGTNNIAHEDLSIEIDTDSLEEVLEGHRRRYFSTPYIYEKVD